MNIERLDWGKTNRLALMFKPDKNGDYHTVMLAIDHPYFYGPTTGLIDPRKTIIPLVQYADAISPAKGTLEHCLDPLITTPVILRVTGGNSIRRKEELSDEQIITSIAEAVRLNAIGVSVSVYVDTNHQGQTIKNLGTLANEASKYGLLVLGITAVGANLDEMRNDPEEFSRYLAHAGRIIQENGADIVKTYYCDNWERVREGIQTPIVLAGGKKVSTKDALVYTYNGINLGADGVDMGRNIFQNDYPVAMIKSVRSIVHEGYEPEDAYKLYQKLTTERQ